MNNPIEDKNLVNFLKQHRPVLPDKQTDLEPYIMAAIQEESSTSSRDKGKISNPLLLSRIAKVIAKIPKRVWIYSPAIAASLLVAWSGYQTITPAKLSSSEEAHLEAFLVNNWEEAVDNDNWLPLNFTNDN